MLAVMLLDAIWRWPRMVRRNCWEAMKCGRQPAGEDAEQLGACPAALPNEHFDGVNKGKHCGRFCWAVAGTLCGGKVQGNHAKKFMAVSYTHLRAHETRHDLVC